MNDLQTRLEAIVRDAPSLMSVLRTSRRMALPDWLIVSGAVYQRVWNHLTARDPDYGIRDYDLAYFDPDTSYEAEDIFIKRAAALFPPPFDALVEVRNQARVHLWFADHFKTDEPYPALSDSAEALTRFLAPAFAVGVRLEADDSLTVEAPFGLEDLFALRLSPTARGKGESWARVVASAKARWPEITVVG